MEATSVGVSPPIDGLEALLTAAECSNELAAAERWCRENGATSAAELAAVSVQLRANFAAALSLTTVKRDRLVQELDR